MKTSNYIFIALMVLLLISAAVGLGYVGGFTKQIIFLIIVAVAVSLVTSGIRNNFFVRNKEKDERNIIIEHRAKAKAFDITGIVVGAQIIICAFLKVDLLVILVMISAYAIISLVYLGCFGKYHDNM